MVDMERKKDKTQQEGISCARFNQNVGTSFLYGTTQGKTYICDVRENSDFHKGKSSVSIDSSKGYVGKASAFNKWTNAVSDARFIGDNNIVTRDYMTVKLWDLRSSGKPLYSAQVTDYLERNLASLMDQDCLDDQFFMDVTPDGKHIATGGYNKSAHVIDINATTNTVVPCNFGASRDSTAGKLKVYNKNTKRLVTQSNLETKLDAKKSVNLGCWCP